MRLSTTDNLIFVQFQDLLFSGARNGNGYFITILKKERGLAKENENSINDQVQDANYCVNDARADIEWLKKTVVNAENLPGIKKKLISTAELRTEMLMDKALNILEIFPYFFTSPQLVGARIHRFIMFRMTFTISFTFTGLIRLRAEISTRQPL